MLHLALIPTAYWIAFLLRFDGAVPANHVSRFWDTLPLLIVLRLGAFAAFRQFRGWWRYVGMHDLAALVSALSWSTLLFLAALFITGQIGGFPRSIVFLDWGVALVLFGGIRFAVRWFREGRMARNGSGERKRTVIIGAGDAASQLIRQARLDTVSGIHPVGLVDDNPSKRNIELHGVPVLGTTRDLDRLVVEHRVELLVVAIAAATRDEMRKIAERCTGLNVEFKIVPSLLELMDGKARLSQLRSVSVEDLLGRPSVRLDLQQVDRDIHGTVVLITGAAGSIGSELARQVAAFRPQRLILLEQAESPLFFIEQEIVDSHPELEIVPIIADVTDSRRIDRIFADFQPSVVFHAAAYKHVPMMETNLEEAIRNNVMGTFHVARSAVRHQAAKFVLISTDKAVRPSSVMGASKRIAERIVLGWPEFRRSPTDFRAVRFGNVLGSQGSVIPVFRQQIANGGPVTVTHPEMQRYFMTIPEAVQLVLQASALPEAAGRISMLDMGEPMRILEMAEAYKPAGIDAVKSTFKDPNNLWFATTGYFAGFCVNTEVLKKRNLPMPTSWQDLLNPVYKGQIVMPNAASSGTGYLQIVSLLQMKGEEKGWQYLKDLDGNMAQYIKSGSRPCKMAATGEYAIGLSFAFSGVKQIMEGSPIKLVIPSEGAGYEIEVSMLMKTAKNKADAKQFLDWLLTLDAAKLYGERAEMSSVPGAKATPEGIGARAAASNLPDEADPPEVLKAGLPADVSTVLYKDMDFAASAKNKDRILAEWKQKIER